MQAAAADQAMRTKVYQGPRVRRLTLSKTVLIYIKNYSERFDLQEEKTQLRRISTSNRNFPSPEQFAGVVDSSSIRTVAATLSAFSSRALLILCAARRMSTRQNRKLVDDIVGNVEPAK